MKDFIVTRRVIREAFELSGNIWRIGVEETVLHAGSGLVVEQRAGFVGGTEAALNGLKYGDSFELPEGLELIYREPVIAIAINEDGEETPAWGDFTVRIAKASLPKAGITIGESDPAPVAGPDEPDDKPEPKGKAKAKAKAEPKG